VPATPSVAAALPPRPPGAPAPAAPPVAEPPVPPDPLAPLPPPAPLTPLPDWHPAGKAAQISPALTNTIAGCPARRRRCIVMANCAAAQLLVKKVSLYRLFAPRHDARLAPESISAPKNDIAIDPKRPLDDS